MKEKLLSIATILITLSVVNGYAQDKKTVKAKLNDATVFFQGAELTHSASSALAKGEDEIYIEGLSPNIDSNSLKIKTTNGVIVSTYEFSVDFLSEVKSSNTIIRKLQDSLDIYEKKLEQIKTDIKITDNLISLLQKGTDKNVSGSEKGLGIDELVKTMDYYKTKSLELQNTQSANNKKNTEIDNSLARIKKQLSQESLKNNKTSGILKLTLSSPVAATCDFIISYYTTAATWIPYYDINIASTDKPIEIKAKSHVRQTTGLDWEKVKLTLSTAIPSNGKTAPLFNTWFLNFQNTNISQALGGQVAGISATQNSFTYKGAPAKEVVREESDSKDNSELWIRGISTFDANKQALVIVDGKEVDSDYMSSLSPDKIKDFSILKDASATGIYGSRGENGVIVITLKNSMDDYITQTENELNIVYNIDMPYTIPGNGKEQNIDLQTKETEAEYEYYCAPKIDTETYLLAEISNWEQLKLLSGKANITYDGTYVGESFIDAHSTHEKLTLTLGTDKRVSVKREKMQDFSSTKFLGNDTKQVFTYKLTVRNSQNKPVKMVLKDQYPISTQKNIEVELITKDTTPWTVNKEDLGVITWEEDLKAGEVKTYQISYSVKYPKGSSVNL